MFYLKNKKNIPLLFFVMFCPHLVFAQSPQHIFSARTASSQPSAIYEELWTNAFQAKDQALLPATPCPDGQIIYVLGTLSICTGGNWFPISGLWTQNGSSLYLANPSISVGIGTASPDTNTNLEIFQTASPITAGANTAFDIVEAAVSAPATGRWSLRAYNNYPVASSLALPNAFAIDNIGTAGIGSLVITQDGNVNIIRRASVLPGTLPPMLNVQNNSSNALLSSPQTIDFNQLAATFTINDPAVIGNAVATGIGFGIGPQAPGSIIQGAIITERTNAGSGGGKMHFGTLNGSVGANLPITLTIHENSTGSRVAIGSSGATTPSHLLIQRQVASTPNSAIIILNNPTAIAPPDQTGIIQFLFPPSNKSVRIVGNYDGEILVDKSNKNLAAISLNSSNKPIIKIYDTTGSGPVAGYIQASFDNTRTLRGSVNSAGVTTTGSGGFTSSKTPFPNVTFIINFTTPFQDIPIVTINTSTAGVYYRIIDVQSSFFTVKFQSGDGIMTPLGLNVSCPFSFTTIGKR